MICWATPRLSAVSESGLGERCRDLDQEASVPEPRLCLLPSRRAATVRRVSSKQR